MFLQQNIVQLQTSLSKWLNSINKPEFYNLLLEEYSKLKNLLSDCLNSEDNIQKFITSSEERINDNLPLLLENYIPLHSKQGSEIAKSMTNKLKEITIELFEKGNEKCLKSAKTIAQQVNKI